MALFLLFYVLLVVLGSVAFQQMKAEEGVEVSHLRERRTPAMIWRVQVLLFGESKKEQEKDGA